MIFSSEKWLTLCDKAKYTHEESLRILADMYEQYKCSKKNYDDVCSLHSSDPNAQKKIDETCKKCRNILEFAEQMLKRSLENVERSAEVRQDTEQLAAAAATAE